MSSDIDWIAFAEQRFGLQFKKMGRDEFASSCPFCGGRDRFHIWRKGNYWCRPGPGHCARSGWLDELDGGLKALTKEEILELRVARLERQQREHEARLTAIEKMHTCTDHLQYHQSLEFHPEAVDYWLNEGISSATIARYMLGYCPSCPTAPGYASYTIPVLFHGSLFNIRHRLANPPNGGKYRPHVSGLPAMLFNGDDLARFEEGRILILEGEKKSMVVGQETGFPNVATMGKQSFKPEWVPKLAKFQHVFVCYDPDAREQATEVARLFGPRGRVVYLPFKADDFFTQQGGTPDDFAAYLLRARPVQ